MSVIIYGRPEVGHCVHLNVTRVHQYRREAVYNGNDYLYTRHTLAVDAVFNPGTQQEAYQGRLSSNVVDGPQHVAPPVPDFRPISLGPLISPALPPHAGINGFTIPGNRPASFTAEQVKHYLMQPRLRLLWAWGFQPVLTSPLPGTACDSSNGPRPISCDVVETHSGKTFLVRWVIQTDLNECPNFSYRPNAVLSNSFGQTDDLDEDFYVTRTTEGTAVLDAAVLRTPSINGVDLLTADNLRPNLLLPVPSNMKRQHVRVRLEPDGVTVRYQVVDREKALNWSWPGITRVEASHQIIQEMADTKLSIKPGGIGADISLRRAVAQIGSLRPFLDRQFGRWVGGMVENLTALGTLLTTSTHVVNVKAWAHRGTKRNDIEAFIREVITRRIAPLKVGYVPILIRSEVLHDVAGTHAEGTSVYLAGPLGPDKDPIPTRAAVGAARMFGEDNNTGGILISEMDNVTIQRPPDDDKSRGTQLEALIASALSNPCQPNNTPPDEPETRLRAEQLPSPTHPEWPLPENLRVD
jgi:hypothetical protein